MAEKLAIGLTVYLVLGWAVIFGIAVHRTRIGIKGQPFSWGAVVFLWLAWPVVTLAYMLGREVDDGRSGDRTAEEVDREV